MMADDGKQRAVKVRHEILGVSYMSRLIDIRGLTIGDMLDGAPLGEKYTIELLEMTQEEFDALPEFTGF